MSPGLRHASGQGTPSNRRTGRRLMYWSNSRRNLSSEPHSDTWSGTVAGQPTAPKNSHSSKKTQAFLAQFGGRVVLHFLPPYCPDDNRIERVWLDLHANVTRNHRCKSMEELMAHVVAFMRSYNRRKKLNPSLRPAVAVSGSRSDV